MAVFRVEKNANYTTHPAVELSFLTEEEQSGFLDAMDYGQATPSLSQAQRLKKQSQEGTATLESMCEIMNEIKKDDIDRVTFKANDLRKYFPKSYTPKQMHHYQAAGTVAATAAEGPVKVRDESGQIKGRLFASEVRVPNSRLFLLSAGDKEFCIPDTLHPDKQG